jgi:signal transduction histidine kinase
MNREEIHELNFADRRIAAMSRLVLAVQELSLARSMAAVTAIVRTVARELTGADGATFILRDGDRCHYVDEDAIGPLWKGQKFPMSACVSGWAMINARSAVIPDIFDDPRVPVDAYRSTFVKSLVMVPIRAQQPIGAIGAYWSRHYRASAHEVELLQSLAHTTAVALENIQVYEELEQRVEERTRELRMANESLESFSYCISHDLRNPLATISGYAALAENEPAVLSSRESREYVAMIRMECARMAGLITDLLKMAALDRVNPERSIVDLSRMANEVIERLRAGDPRRQVEYLGAPGLLAQGDQSLLRAVIDNLLSNAWKYSSKTAQAVIEFGLSESNDKARTFFVRDNGAGFDPEQAGQLFAPFHRLHPRAEFPGTGVGLASARRIIERHGGRIWATAVPGEGATFQFTLPNVMPEMQQAR